ncbi:MAG: 23S rRNA (pseudouridine(1915)-N(3))-methyltransferase RlmH [Beijerinckiaceae bacterium]
MRLVFICVGRTKAGPERELAARYLDRAVAAGRSLGFTGLVLHELDESRARRAEDRKAEEAKAIRSALGADTAFLVFDETGEMLTSEAFARRLGGTRDRRTPALGLVIGGPDGLDAGLQSNAEFAVAFGRLTWPHQLVRIMAAEQIYRAMTILAGHPYHRA